MAMHHDKREARPIECDREIQMIARRLCNGDMFLAQELRSEMYIAILSLEVGLDKALYLRVAKCRAIDYLRSRAKNYSYGGAVKHISLEAMEEAGFQIDTERNVYAPENHSSVFVEDSADSYIGTQDD
jgi:hypothetical protein